MSIFPEILAAFGVCSELANDRVTVKDPTVPFSVPSDPIALMNSFPDAYSIELVPLREGVNVVSQGRFGVADPAYRMVEFPVPHTDPGFSEALRAALVPVINEEIERVNALSVKDHAESPDGPFESADAIREIR